MSDLDIAWAAGLFEGEGSVYLMHDSKTGRTYPQLDLTSTDEDVVRRFAQVVGSRGRVYGPYQRATRKPFWRCTLTGQTARKALGLIGPQLGERRTARMQEVLAQADTPIRTRKEQ